MKRLALIGLLCLCACRRDGKSALSLSTASSRAPVATNGLVVFMGQSNAQALWGNVLPDVLAAIQPRFPGVSSAINCALGNTSLSQWESGQPLNTACLDQIATTGKEPVLIIWWQGEYEAQNGNADGWGQRFLAMMNSFRSSLGKSSMPVAYVRLSDDTAGLSYWNVVRNEQTSVCLHGGVMVNVDGIARAPGDVHYSVPGYQAVAARIGLAVQDIP